MGDFVAIVVLTNTVGTKLFVVGDVTLPTSLMWFPVTFLITDIVSEVYGAKRAQMLVWAGFLASLGLLVSVLVALALPASPIYALDAEFSAVFSPTWRLLFASMAASCWRSRSTCASSTCSRTAPATGCCGSATTSPR